MKETIINLGLSLLKSLLRSSSIHERLRLYAKSTENEFDDVGIEQAIVLFNKVADMLEKK